MLAGTGIRHSSAITRTHISKHAISFRSQRQLSSFTALRNSRSRLTPVGRSRNGLTGVSPALIPGPLSARFLSSTPATPNTTPSSANPNDSTLVDELVPEVSNGSESIDGLSASTLADVDLSQIPEKIGYLKALGLDYGWGPSSMVETLLESVHIYGQLPWYGSTIVVAIIIRLLMLKPILTASDVSAKLQTIKPIISPVRERMMKCARESDNMGALKAKQELALLHEQYDLKPWKAFVPLLQIPLGFACFRVLRGMAALPVPGLYDESCLWLTNVTVVDPFYILPLITGATMYLTIKRGGDTGVNNMAGTPFGKVLLYGLPLLTTGTMSFWPSLLQLYFATTGGLSLAQSYVTTSPGFRNWAGLAPIPKAVSPDASAETPQSKVRAINTTAKVSRTPDVHTPPPNVSFIDRTMENVKSGVRDSVKQVQEKMDSMTGEKSDSKEEAPPRLTKKELEKAKAYEKRRREELATEREMRNRQLKADYYRQSENRE